MSFIILIISYIMLQGNISKKIIIKCLFPTFFNNNWYMTCYILFYLFHPIFNSVIKSMNQITHLRTTLFLTIVYIFINFVKSSFFASEIMLWLTIYFIVAYMQNYLMSFADNLKYNVIFFLLNALCFVGLILVSEFCGLHIQALSGQMKRWINNCNPFIIFMSFALFNIARNIHFKNRFINYISGLSLLIYIIHENLIIRKYLRPITWSYIYTNFGHAHVMIWVFVFAAAMFVFAGIAAAFYTAIAKKAVSSVSNHLYLALKKVYLSAEEKLLKAHKRI